MNQKVEIKWMIVGVFLFFSLGGTAQSKSQFNRLIEEINTYLNHYSQLYPMDEDYLPIANFNLSKKEIKELLQEASYDATLSVNKDSIQSYHMIFYFQEKIMNHLETIVLHPHFNVLFNSELITSEELSIVVSDDGKLYNFSIDGKTGGTYRSRISMMYFTDLFPKDSTTLSNFSASFNPDGYSNLYHLNTPEGSKYVLAGYVRGCTYCFETFVDLISIQDNEVTDEFSYSVSNRDWNDGVVYHPETKTIEVDYHTDDLTPYCYCDPDFEFDWEDVDEHDISYINCKCKFIFNTTEFELIEESWKKVLHDDE